MCCDVSSTDIICDTVMVILGFQGGSTSLPRQIALSIKIAQNQFFVN